MAVKVFGWLGLISVLFIGLFGFGLYFSFLMFIVSFVLGLLTILCYKYDEKKIFLVDIDSLDDPLQQQKFSMQPPKIIELFKKEPTLSKFDSRITGSDAVDAFLNEIVMIIINDYVSNWYEILTDDQELTTHAIRKLVLNTGVNIANRVKSVDWIYLLSNKFSEEFTTHLKLFKQSRVRLKHINLLDSKYDVNNTKKTSPKKLDVKKVHRRNKSDTDLSWPNDSTVYGKSKFYDSNHDVGGTLKDIFFELECAMEKRQICRDIFCIDADKENELLCEVSKAVLYLVTPEEAWKCHPLKLILIDLLSSVVLKPILELLSDPDNINRSIIKMCCPDINLSSELFLSVIRCSSDLEELNATLEMVQKDIQKLHSKDSAGEWEIHDRQKLSSLQYLARIIQARKATLGPQAGLEDVTPEAKVPEEVTRSLKFLSETTAWRSNAQYCLDIELSETDAHQTSKTLIENLRSSALELCDLYLAPNRPPIIGVPDNCYLELVRKITTDGDEFTSNAVTCFDDVQKCVYEALEDDPSWQNDYMMDGDQDSDLSTRRDDPTESKKSTADTLIAPGSHTRHNRSRSDIVGNKMVNESSGTSNLSSANTSNLSLSHSQIHTKSVSSILSACIIETALVQEKGKAFGIYAIAVTRLSDNEVWHIYRRYSDFYDLHSAVKEKWPELNQLPFPAKKTFQNTSRSVLENRKRMLNSYLQSLTSLSREARYGPLLTQDYLGGFLSQENQFEKNSNSIDALLVNSLRAGMRTLKNMPDQLANTVDGVMDGISKVFQGKHEENFDSLKSTNLIEQDDGDDSAALKLLEEVLGIRGLWLRRRLLAPLRTLIGDRVNRKVLELVATLTSPRNIVTYLKTFKQWLTNNDKSQTKVRDSATKARARVAAKVALLSACSDDLKHIVGSDTARRGLLTVFDLFQTQDINKRIVLVLLESILYDLFPDNNLPDLFRRIYNNSPRVPAAKKSVNI